MCIILNNTFLLFITVLCIWTVVKQRYTTVLCTIPCRRRILLVVWGGWKRVRSIIVCWILTVMLLCWWWLLPTKLCGARTSHWPRACRPSDGAAIRGLLRVPTWLRLLLMLLLLLLLWLLLRAILRLLRLPTSVKAARRRSSAYKWSTVFIQSSLDIRAPL